MRPPLHATALRRLLPTALLLLALVLASPSWAGASSASSQSAHSSAKAKKRKKRKKTPPVRRASLLWATVDACNPPDRANTIGIRGSMPGDGNSGEQMYVRFRVQYQDPSSGRYLYVQAADSGFILVGPATARFRQAGRNFQFQLSNQPPPYRPRYVLRGAVDFQWRKKNKVVRAAAKTTSAPHPTGAAGDRPGYTAAGCTLS